MTPFPSHSPPPATDWLESVRRCRAAEGDVLALDELRAGDQVQVMTRHTLYEFVFIDGAAGTAVLRTNRPDRPVGPVKIMGCAYGAGSTIAPGRLFNGGSLEYTSQAGCKVHRTTAIAWIRLLRQFS